MARMEPRGSAEQPLQGVMLCFTSVGPEDRSRYADIVMQMGAEHKLDLTSDTTHLIVGSTDTLKYQYVAREREDIKVLRPEWIEAVRDHWIKDLPLDLDTLTQQYRMPTLAGLKICITGFDDLGFRAQLQKNVKENGGEYTGDLTKDVTHLIAAKPEGKKYEYGMQWQKKVVSLKWYKDTLERGMQLDERLYHPTVPVSEQGLGAWNRKARRSSPQLGKRTREENHIGAEPSRKLRRTASAKFGSQTQDMWSDIVGGAGFQATNVEHPVLKPSISMPGLRELARPANAASNHRAGLINGDPAATGTKTANLRFLAGRLFVVKCFEEKRSKHLQNVLVEYGATIISEGEDPEENKPGNIITIQPHDIGKNGSTPTGCVEGGFQAVSELWLEKCMLAKSFIDPGRYPLGQILSEPLSCLKDLTINATGFDGLEAVHISKIVTLLGGNYSQMFAAGVSILVCKAGSAKKDKLDLAQRLGIPAVTEEWLWSTINNQTKANVESYLVRQSRPRTANSERPMDKRSRSEDYVEVSTIPLPRNAGDHKANQQSKPAGTGTQNGHAPEKAVKKSSPRLNIQEEPVEEVHGEAKEGPSASSSENGASGRNETKGRSCDEGPLRVLSPNGRNTRLVNNPPMVETLDGISRMDDSTSKENAPAPSKSGARPEVQTKTTDIEAINGAIRDILNEHSRKKSASGNQNDPLKKNRLFGRALSNLSNSSTVSNMRCSRASSIDSINTDGMGSELVTMQSVETQSGESASTAEKSTFNFTGRAKQTLAALKSAPLEMDDPDMPRNVGFPTEQDAAPPMTQLGYEDPEEAILLREKLAASRKTGSGKDRPNDEGEVAPPSRRLKSADRKIRDDDLLASVNGGWGAGRRTRHKQRSPPGQGIKDF